MEHHKDAHIPTFLSYLGVVGPLSETAHVFLETDAGLEFGFQDVALVEEKHNINLGKELIRADLPPQEDAILLYIRVKDGRAT